MARKPFFSGNYGSALSSNANAANLIARAGQSQGQMFANLGGQIGGMIQQYGLNKRKRDESEAAFQGKFGRMAEQPGGAEKILAMQNDPVLGPTLKRIQEGKGTQPDFDKFHAFTSADTEQEMQLMKQRAMKSDIATQLLENENRRLRNKIGAETKDDVVAQTKAKTEADKSKANMLAIDEAYHKTEKALNRENTQSSIDYRNTATLGMLLQQMKISTPIPEDLEKRFSETATLLGKNDDSMVRVRTSGLFGGEEKEIPYKEFKENAEDYAPLVNERIKALQANEERLKKEQTNVIQRFKIPVIDKETGEQIFITLQEKMEYDEKRKQLQNQKDLERSRANQINVRSQFQGVRN